MNSGYRTRYPHVASATSLHGELLPHIFGSDDAREATSLPSCRRVNKKGWDIPRASITPSRVCASRRRKTSTIGRILYSIAALATPRRSSTPLRGWPVEKLPPSQRPSSSVGSTAGSRSNRASASSGPAAVEKPGGAPGAVVCMVTKGAAFQS